MGSLGGGGGGGEGGGCDQVGWNYKKKAMWLYPKVTGFNPSERWGHSACYSHANVYIFGGCCGGLHYSDVLVLDLETIAWKALATTGQGPGPRDSHTAVLVGQRMIVFGGTNGSKKVNDLHVLDLMTKEWSSPECGGTPPSPRESHTSTLVGDDKLVIFGGSGEGQGNYLSDLHVLDIRDMRWSTPEVKGDVPVPRDSHSAVAIGSRLFVYGGDCGDRYNEDVAVFDMSTLTWSKLCLQGPLPGVRAGHVAVNLGSKVFVIGGVGDQHYYADIWVLDVVTCVWTKLDTCGQQPRGRFSHTAVLAGSDIVIYGGCGDDERPLNELLVLQLGAEHPKGLYNISMVFGSRWYQERQKQSGELENKSLVKSLRTTIPANNEAVQKEVHEQVCELKRPFWLNSDAPHPKRKRTVNPKLNDADSEQEEHSLTFSQHSSPSHSDQERPPSKKTTVYSTPSEGFNLFRQNHATRSCPLNDGSTLTREAWKALPRNQSYTQVCIGRQKADHHGQLVHAAGQTTPFPIIEQKPVERRSVCNMMGAEVRGRVDGAFDSGLLMTAIVDGRLYRGVLFAPVHEVVYRAPQMNNSQAFPISDHVVDPSKPSHRPSTPFIKPESGQNLRQARLVRSYPATRTPTREPSNNNPRSDLEGVVLTLGGPGTSNIGRM